MSPPSGWPYSRDREDGWREPAVDNMKVSLFAIFAAALLLGGCGLGGALNPLNLIPSPTPTPPLTTVPKSLTMQTSGASSQQTITASESGNSFFSAQTTNVNVASVAPVNGTTNAFMVTAVAAGTCSIKVSDGNGQTVSVAVTVN